MKWNDEQIDELVEYLCDLEDEGYTLSEIEEMRHRYVDDTEAEHALYGGCE